MNLELCNLEKLWKNAATTEKANIISYYDQDYICLLTEVNDANSLTLNLNDAATCLRTIGLLKINQPKDTSNTFTVNLSNQINNIHSIVVGPNSTLNIQGSHDSMSFNFLNSSIISMSGSYFGLNLSIFQCNTDHGCSLTEVTGTIRTLIDSAGQIQLISSKLINSNIKSYAFSIDYKSSLSNCDLRCNNTLNLFTNKIENTFCSGNIINYAANKFDLACTAYSSININAALVNGGTLIGSGPQTIAYINNPKLVTALRLEKIPYLKITSDQLCEIKGTYNPSESLNLVGADTENNSSPMTLAASFSTNTRSVTISNFINYGTINSETVTLSNGSNYGIIKGRSINVDSSVNNYGIIQQI
jgi:hypothetical protein